MIKEKVEFGTSPIEKTDKRTFHFSKEKAALNRGVSRELSNGAALSKESRNVLESRVVVALFTVIQPLSKY